VEEKIQIAIKHLIPKQLEAHGLKKHHIKISAEILEMMIEKYTRESGVRNLEKKLASLIRGIAKKVASREKYEPKITEDDVTRILGAPIFQKEKYQGNDVPGVVTGLAWTPVGGEILFIEASLSQGKGKLTLTGNLGDVMKESATIALAFLRAHAGILNLETKTFDEWDIHIHVPEGATPKDGPSAGVSMMTSLASAFTRRKVKKGIAMTGEITLRGDVLPVGGIKEKILAARRAGISEIILSKHNRKDIEEIKKDYVKDITIHYVEKMTEVIELALTDEVVESGDKSALKNKKTEGILL
jgi:ATP-dependent Lon protease